MKVPKELVNKLRKRLGLPYRTVYNWSVYGVPSWRIEEVGAGLQDIDIVVEEPRQVVKLDGWLVEPLHKVMGLSYQTVNNWAKYGIPSSRQQEVNEAMAAMEKEHARSSKR